MHQRPSVGAVFTRSQQQAVSRRHRASALRPGNGAAPSRPLWARVVGSQLLPEAWVPLASALCSSCCPLRALPLCLVPLAFPVVRSLGWSVCRCAFLWWWCLGSSLVGRALLVVRGCCNPVGRSPFPNVAVAAPPPGGLPGLQLQVLWCSPSGSSPCPWFGGGPRFLLLGWSGPFSLLVVLLRLAFPLVVGRSRVFPPSTCVQSPAAALHRFFPLRQSGAEPPLGLRRRASQRHVGV